MGEHVTPAPSAAAVRTFTHRPLRSLGIGRTAESSRADGTVTSPRGPTVRPMARIIHPRGRNCQGRILGKIIFGRGRRRARAKKWSRPPGGASRGPRGGQRGQSVRERDCIGTGSGRGGNPRFFGRMGWGWGGGARCGVGQLAAAGGAARRGVLAVQEQCGRANVGGLAAFVGPSSGGWRSVNARRARIFRGFCAFRRCGCRRGVVFHYRLSWIFTTGAVSPCPGL